MTWEVWLLGYAFQRKSDCSAHCPVEAEMGVCAHACVCACARRCVYVYTGTHVYAGYRPFVAKYVVLETMTITPTTL